MLFRLPLHNELVGSFVVPRLVPQCGFTPWCQRVVPLHPAFTSAMRMIYRIHDHTANGRTYSHMAMPPGLSDRDVLMIEIAYLSNRCRAVHIHQSHFSRRKFDVSVSAFLRYNLCGSARAAGHLRPLSGTKLNVVNGRAEGN